MPNANEAVEVVEAALDGRGAQPVAEMHVAYVRYPHGVLGRITQTGPVGEISGGGVEITKAQYDAELAEYKAASAALVAELAAADRANVAADYRELRAAGVADATARRMTGHDGEDYTP